MPNVAGIENNVITNMVGVPDWEEWAPILRLVLPQYEWIVEWDLPPDAWIGWYRDENGNWIDNSPPIINPEVELAKLKTVKST